MKQGRKKIEKDEPGSGKPDPAEIGSKKAGGDDPNTFKVDSEMIGGNPKGIDAVRALQVIGVGFIILELGWIILRYILHII